MRNLLAVLLLTILSYSASAESLMDATQFEGWNAVTEEDKVILAVLRDALFENASIDVETVFATVEYGDVWVYGEVATVKDKQIINEIVHRIDGVGEIDLSGVEH